MDQRQLADFLRTRREALTPADVGLPTGRRRRTAGLRREEVAALAMISTDYYSRMEQQRGPQPSVDVLASLARALQLTLDERDHLFRLAGHNAPARTPAGEQVSTAMLRILDRLTDTPAQVMSALGETLVQTPAARALLGDETAYQGLARSVVHRWFTDPTSRAVYPTEDHAAIGRNYVAAARMGYARDGAGSRAAEIVDDLLSRSDEFADLWRQHLVGTAHELDKRLVHPALGVLELQCQILHDPTQLHTLLVFTAEPGTPSHAKLAALGADPQSYQRGRSINGSTVPE
ncbi:helix-turn-helix transcriptional regulator [Mycolicibacterium austroafricanum]|uniref:Helix-turn-helix transcriptional regulator n=1 Tax=Mycolicibacterium austroafricanum TaxID=39687 RepID=A0ABT8HHY9_MYCAO|nr:helix-turn-helix transcriptional regulator [Mycolicibacterium austroafricanum]MDN4520380.1 helix-turn-helix transcriptional regulator [Mycolicibacterium austroafricanum]PQP48388.1 transcriptional regulator [Mycolicibacterium austroafricanum]QRZ07740.1 helix-turn-helix domain-containing protein [Mycolicibacterium austroafricanum]QZT69403.1 helix-turn-helix transcriptional regulator [Mycolicibacterium austroafricanum]